MGAHYASNKSEKDRRHYGRKYFNEYGGRGYILENVRVKLESFKVALLDVFVPSLSPFSLRILDVGCAKGFLVQMLRGEGICAYGVDVSEYALGEAPNAITNFLFKADVERDALPFADDFFDIVISISTFEHLRKHKQVLSEVRRVMRDGYLIVNVPNPKIRSQTKDPEHVTMLSKKGWIERVAKEGYSWDAELSKVFERKRVLTVSNFRLSSLRYERLARLLESSKLHYYTMILKRRFIHPSFTLLFQVRKVRDLRPVSTSCSFDKACIISTV